MKFPYSWLGDFVELKQGPTEAAELLTSAGLKVEKIHRLSEGLRGVVVGEVTGIRRHPDADKLTIVDVDSGARPLTIVCGASNFEVGDRVPVAVPGAEIPAVGLIEERKFRGALSQGMLCSSRELGIGEDHSGILVLDRGADIGADVVELLGLTDVVLGLEIPPNRPDAMSLMGIARELAAVARADLKPIPPTPLGSAHKSGPSASDSLTVHVLDPAGCPRYLAMVLENVKVGESGALVQRRLRLSGIRPISNVVDATNYGLMITGHPMHAFDLDRLEASQIVVRRAEAGEELLTIDGEKHALEPDDLVIADASAPVALAGVMGGRNTEVTDSTTRVALESAYFDPSSIYRASKRHGLRSESSARFERGADPNNVAFAADMAAGFICEWAGADPAGLATDFYPKPAEPFSVPLRSARAGAVLGFELSTDQITDVLGRINLKPQVAGDVIHTTIPTYRADLRLEEDLIEEVARLIGYEKIPAKLPSGSNRAGSLSAEMKSIRSLKHALAGAGLSEARTSILNSPADAKAFGIHVEGLMKVANPLSEDESVLRTSLIPGLTRSVGRNFARRTRDVRLFEVGSIFIGPPEKRSEPGRLGLAMGGVIHQEWYRSSRELDFFDLKGAVEVLVNSLRCGSASFEAINEVPFHPTRSAAVWVEGRRVGRLGQLNQQLSAMLDLPYPVFAGEFDLTGLLELSQPAHPAGDTGKFPEVLLDLAVSVPEAEQFADLISTARSAGGESLESIRLIDVYRGEQAGEGRKSLAFSLSFRRQDRTLTEAEALVGRDAIAAAIAKHHGGRVRQ